MMEMIDLSGWNEKLNIFLNNKIRVHIDLFDGTFLNGTIIKKVKEDVWLILEDKLGEVFIFVRDIKILKQNLEVNK